MSEMVLESKQELPKNWIVTHLNELVQPSKEKFDPLREEAHIFIGLEHIESNTGNIIGKDSSKNVRSTKTRFHAGDILYGKLRPYLNKVCTPNFDGVCSTDIFVFTKNPFIESQYLTKFLSTNEFVKFTNQNMKGVQHPRVSFEVISKYLIPLPPLNEQKRIVAKIEELFSKIDSCKQLMENILIQLKQYKQSLLKYAFEGELIPITSKDHTIEMSLEKIEYERRKIFEEAQIRKHGKKIKYVPPREPFENDENLFCKSWKSVSLETVCSVVEGGSTPLRSISDNFDKNGIPLIKVENIMNDGTIRLREDQLRISKKIHQKQWKSKIFPNDVLINIVGMPLGKIGLVQSDIPEANINQAIVVMRTISSYLPKTLLYCLLSPNYYNYQIKMSTGVRQSNIRKSDVGRIPIPLIPIQYQTKMIEKIEKGFSLANNSICIATSMLNMLNVLTQTILKQAFEGKLVSHDPNDESAEILLQKIRQEKEKFQETQKIIQSKAIKQRRIKNAK